MSEQSEGQEDAIPDEGAGGEDAESATVPEEDEERLTGELPDANPFAHPLLPGEEARRRQPQDDRATRAACPAGQPGVRALLPHRAPGRHPLGRAKCPCRRRRRGRQKQQDSSARRLMPALCRPPWTEFAHGHCHPSWTEFAHAYCS